MPGIIPHLIGGGIIYVLGRYYYKDSFSNNLRLMYQLEIFGIILFLSLLPDIFLGVYYLTHILPKSILHTYHDYLHVVLLLIVIGGFLIVIDQKDLKNRPYIITGLSAITIHILLDLIIPSYSILI
jgi:membrane-bound metal-dependent hydrolase YbcI (DUF457 family)